MLSIKKSLMHLACHSACVVLLCFSASHQAFANLSNDDPLSVLPTEANVRKSFEKLPQLRASTLGVNLANDQKVRLEAGSHEWTARVGVSRRNDQLSGQGFQEQELAIERPIRWFGKVEKDRAIGEKGIAVAQASHADQWHEASRSLMKEWFDALRERTVLAQLRQQLEIVEQLAAIAAKRVKAGDAAKVEQLLAETEVQRVRALVQQSEQREEVALQVLQMSYPNLASSIESLNQSRTLPQPKSSLDVKSGEQWLDKIMDDNHELELAQAENDYVGLQAARIAQESMPDPSIGVRSSRERNGQERIVGISISIPLPRAARSSERSLALTKVQIANEKLQQTQMKVRLSAQKIISESQRSYTTWKTMDQLRQQNAQQANLMQSAYRLGEMNLGDVLNARKMALDAAIAADTAQIEALASYARLHLDAHMIWALE